MMMMMMMIKGLVVIEHGNWHSECPPWARDWPWRWALSARHNSWWCSRSAWSSSCQQQGQSMLRCPFPGIFSTFNCVLCGVFQSDWSLPTEQILWLSFRLWRHPDILHVWCCLFLYHVNVFLTILAYYWRSAQYTDESCMSPLHSTL